MWATHNQRRWLLEKDVLPADKVTPFVCECTSAECAEPVFLTAPEYERVHRNRGWTVVEPGHVISGDATRVVERHTQFWVVELVEGGAALPEAVRAADDRLDEAWRAGAGVDEALQEAKRLSDQLGRDPCIEDAKLVIARASGLPPSAAFTCLLEISQRTNRKLREVAHQLVDQQPRLARSSGSLQRSDSSAAGTP